MDILALPAWPYDEPVLPTYPILAWPNLAWMSTKANHSTNMASVTGAQLKQNFSYWM